MEAQIYSVSLELDALIRNSFIAHISLMKFLIQ